MAPSAQAKGETASHKLLVSFGSFSQSVFLEATSGEKYRFSLPDVSQTQVGPSQLSC